MNLDQMSPLTHSDNQGRDVATISNLTVEANLVYLTAKEPAPRSYYREGNDLAERIGQYENVRVAIRDARAATSDPSLDIEGFVLRQVRTDVTDFLDDDQIRNIYHAEVERLVKAETGATKVVVFDHTIRIEREGDEQLGQRAPVRLVHNDYTEKSGPQRVRDLLPPDEAKLWLSGRFAEFNVWRPLRGPVQSLPLAIADAQSVLPDDLVTADLVYPDRVGEIYHAVHSPGHRWYYAPEMAADEVLLFKGYDSAEDGRARFTLHTAFELPERPANAPARESIEIRALASFVD